MLSGTDPHGSATGFDDRGRVGMRLLGDQSDPNRFLRAYGYDSHRRLDRFAFVSGTLAVLQDDRLAIDAVGNVTGRLDARAGIDQWECFRYDQRDGLTKAYTTTASQCAVGNPVDGLDPYLHDYTYSHNGQLTGRTEGAVSAAFLESQSSAN